MRSAYRTKMRLFKDSDREDWVRWYPAPLPAKIFPGWHLFASQNWMRDKALEWPGPGEVKGAARQFVTGRNVPFYLGDCHVGEDQWFREGMPASALLRPIADLPQCCQLPLAFAGVAEVGDQLQFVSTPVVPPSTKRVGFTLAGMNNGSEPTCTNLNRDYVLETPNLASQNYTQTDTVFFRGLDRRWVLGKTAGVDRWIMNLGTPFQMQYRYDGFWDETSPLVMNLQAFVFGCFGPPAFTVTITPLL